MPKFLFNVLETYNSGTSDEYLIVLSDIPEAGADYRNNDVLEVQKPDGTVIQSVSEYVRYTPTAERNLSVALKGLTKEDVPVGSKVWLVNSDRVPRKPSRHYDEVKKPEGKRHSA
ncbi:MAG TPA: hypothetical protein EYM95_11525 [Candidatus Obscuribacterales bacterium]|nr:hypothetical protein [Candidatus Obscuribacterales bacterium]